MTHVERLEQDEWSLTPVTDAIGRTQDTYVANEYGLYFLVLGSRKPEAKAFKRWITHEVIPAIRASGIQSLLTEIFRLVVTGEKSYPNQSLDFKKLSFLYILMNIAFMFAFCLGPIISIMNQPLTFRKLR